MTNAHERLGQRLDIRARLGPQGNVHEKLGPQEGQPRGVITTVCGVVELIFWNISDSRGAKAVGHTWGQGVAPMWMPYFASSRGLVNVNDSLLLDNDVAIGVAKSLVTPRDVPMLRTRDDNQLVIDAMALSMQSAVSIASLGHRHIMKSYEVQVLRSQLVAERNLVANCLSIIRILKRERAKTLEETRHQLEILQVEN
ncbi:unnamed protein product [Prunus brigantina]